MTEIVFPPAFLRNMMFCSEKYLIDRYCKFVLLSVQLFLMSEILQFLQENEDIFLLFYSQVEFKLDEDSVNLYV